MVSILALVVIPMPLASCGESKAPTGEESKAPTDESKALTAESVCEHVMDLVNEKSEIDRKKCPDNLRRMKERIGDEKYAELLACANAATDKSTLDLCEGLRKP